MPARLFTNLKTAGSFAVTKSAVFVNYLYNANSLDKPKVGAGMHSTFDMLERKRYEKMRKEDDS
jgi:hypothetical protein